MINYLKYYRYVAHGSPFLSDTVATDHVFTVRYRYCAMFCSLCGWFDRFCTMFTCNFHLLYISPSVDKSVGCNVFVPHIPPYRYCIIRESSVPLRHATPTCTLPLLTPPRYKTWHACQIKTTLCRAIRGGVYSLSPHLEPRNCHLTIGIAITALRAWGLRTTWHHFNVAAAHADQ